MLSYKEAYQIILENVEQTKEVEIIDLKEANNRITAENIKANINIPPFNRSAMDGYAIISGDTVNATEEKAIVLKVIGESIPGAPPKIKLSRGEAMKISTGALIPKGADAVVILEDVENLGEKILIRKRIKSGENISKSGEDIKIGETVIEKHTRITPPLIGILASLGKTRIKVFAKPKVCIFTTGDELVEPYEGLSEGKIYDSNGYMLSASVAEAGCQPIRKELLPDDEKSILNRIKGIANVDAIICNGGISVGEKDFLRSVLKKVGVEEILWKVKIKPGKPFFFGKLKNIPVFVLPGFPVSTFVTFEVFVRPALIKMSGGKELNRRKVTALLAEEIKRKSGRTEFMRAYTYFEGGKFRASVVGEQRSTILSAFASANSLIEIPEEISVIPEGCPVISWLLQ